MTDLKHRGMLIVEMLDAHWVNYSYTPKESERSGHIEWAKRLDEETLRHALDYNNHNVTGSGQRMKPNLATLRDIAYQYRDARGDFFRPPLSDTSLLEGPICIYCAEGDVYDFVFEGDTWSLKRKGTCAICSGGTARGNPIFIEIAEQLNTDVGKVIWQFSIALLHYKFHCGLEEITKANVIAALEVFRQQQVANIPVQSPDTPVTPAKDETGTQVRPELEAPAEKKYDFGDGFERENPNVPF